MYKAELQEASSVEGQLVEALPKMAEEANSSELKQALQMHLEETRGHQQRVEGLLRAHGAGTGKHTDQSMQAMISEAGKWAGMVKQPSLRDAGLVASAQRVEHYEIAIYGTLTTWAKQLGLQEDLRTLHEILEQEKKADAKLTELAKADVNPAAQATAR
jgi:ferritin-like metal-binding protein YciE